mmetsp:Transcript_8948/g.28243  ORF Transcript_8948/g.28243 Transcript_8948/m.28243 type:complete len:260 (+) Transcript_8948:3832-4611(+)
MPASSATATDEPWPRTVKPARRSTRPGPRCVSRTSTCSPAPAVGCGMPNATPAVALPSATVASTRPVTCSHSPSPSDAGCRVPSTVTFTSDSDNAPTDHTSAVPTSVKLVLLACPSTCSRSVGASCWPPAVVEPWPAQEAGSDTFRSPCRRMCGGWSVKCTVSPSMVSHDSSSTREPLVERAPGGVDSDAPDAPTGPTSGSWLALDIVITGGVTSSTGTVVYSKRRRRRRTLPLVPSVSSSSAAAASVSVSVSTSAVSD